MCKYPTALARAFESGHYTVLKKAGKNRYLKLFFVFYPYSLFFAPNTTIYKK